jgi:tetratricopeptide (TPR) repeat protein
MQARYPEAEPRFKRAVEIAEKVLGPTPPSVGTYVDNLALVYLAQARLTEAEPRFKCALEIFEKAFGTDHPGLGMIVNNLAMVDLQQGRYITEPVADGIIYSELVSLVEPGVDQSILHDIVQLYR